MAKNYKLIAKKSVWWWRLIGKIYPFALTDFWTTIGHNIYYPPSENLRTDDLLVILNHEKVHIKQYDKFSVPVFLFLYLFIPLPIFFSYFRWKFEREAYLTEIKAGTPIDYVVDELWNCYFYPWPKRWMKKWFEKQPIKRD